MNKRQLKDSQRGVQLLLSHLGGRGETLDVALQAHDADAADAMADPLVNIAVILVRQLKEALQSDVDAALTSARRFANPDLADAWDVASSLISAIISGQFPPSIDAAPCFVALGAQEIAAGSVRALGEETGKHPNAIVASIRNRLKEQDEDVQLSDKESVEVNMAAHATDPVMRKSRFDTAFVLVRALDKAAAVPLHDIACSLEQAQSSEARDR